MPFTFSVRKLQTSASEVATGSEVATAGGVARTGSPAAARPQLRPLAIALPSRAPPVPQRLPIAAGAAPTTRRSPTQLSLAAPVGVQAELPAMSEALASSLMNVPDLVMQGLSMDKRAERHAAMQAPGPGPQAMRWNETAVRAAWAVRRDKVMGEVMPLVDHYLESCPPDYRFTRIKNDCKALLRTLEDPARGISALPRRELLDVLSIVKGIRPGEVLERLHASDKVAASATMRHHLEQAAFKNVYDATMYLGMELLSPYD